MFLARGLSSRRPGSILDRSAQAATTARRKIWGELRPAATLLRRSHLAVLDYAGSLAGDAAVPLRMLYAGDASLAGDFESFLGADASRDVERPKELFRGSLLSYPFSRIQYERSRRQPYDIILSEHVPMLPRGDDDVVHYPFLDGYLDVKSTVDQQVRGVRSRSYRKLLRDARRRPGRRWIVRRDSEALSVFRRELHEPYVRFRFGKRAAIEDLEPLARLYERCGAILFVEVDGATTAAAILLHDFAEPGVLTYHRNGIRDAHLLSPDELTNRMAALEMSLMEYAIEHRMRQIDLGFTRAIVNDGRFVHKRRLGCTFRPSHGAPRFRLYCRPELRPAFFGRFALLAGSPDAYALHLGYDGRARSAHQWRMELKNYMVPGLRQVHCHVGQHREAPGADEFGQALREVLGDRELIVE